MQLQPTGMPACLAQRVHSDQLQATSGRPTVRLVRVGGRPRDGWMGTRTEDEHEHEHEGQGPEARAAFASLLTTFCILSAKGLQRILRITRLSFLQYNHPDTVSPPRTVSEDYANGKKGKTRATGYLSGAPWLLHPWCNQLGRLAAAFLCSITPPPPYYYVVVSRSALFHCKQEREREHYIPGRIRRAHTEYMTHGWPTHPSTCIQLIPMSQYRYHTWRFLSPLLMKVAAGRPRFQRFSCLALAGLAPFSSSVFLSDL